MISLPPALANIPKFARGPGATLLAVSLAVLASSSGCAEGAPAGAPVAAPEAPTTVATMPWQQILVSALDDPEAVRPGGWHLSGAGVRASDLPAKFGSRALTMSGVAEDERAKADFVLAGAIAGAARNLSLWVYVAPDANVATMGLQVRDAEGEYLIMGTPVDWRGWKQVSFDLATVALVQTWPQGDKNNKIDLPLTGVNLIWHPAKAGPTSLTVDALTAATEAAAEPAAAFQAQWTGSVTGEPNLPFGGQLVVTNFSAGVQSPGIEYSIQRDPAYYSKPPLDPVFGGDLAAGKHSWTEEKGRVIEEGSLTDEKDWTLADSGWGDHTELFQYVDLAMPRLVTHLVLGPTDANWLFDVDIAASLDGVTYTPVEGLQNLDLHRKYGPNPLDVPHPFNARFIRLRYHKGDGTSNSFWMPSSLGVYDGAADENWALPAAGEVVAHGNLSPGVAAHTFESVALPPTPPLAPGSYLLAALVTVGPRKQQIYSHFLAKPPVLAGVGPASRFGLNVSNLQISPAALHRRLGIGWVRFENMKWMMAASKPDEFHLDAGVQPWDVHFSDIIDAYTGQGISVLPFLFMTPDYATSAPVTVKQGRWSSYPPKDNALMGDFVFQTVARYGNRKHGADELKTADKVSGLDKMKVYEIWNEENLTDPGWGPWVGTTEQYNLMFRAAAEAAKKADPSAQVTNGGFAGIDVSTADTLLQPYADGKKPLDFVDILNVHFYSGQIAPEVSTVDGNANRSGAAPGLTYEESLRRLVAWRDRHKPGLPIWMTETGYDSAGGFGTNEQYQAARLPREIMMALAAGLDKVMVYRESGSTASMHSASGLQRDDGTLKPSWFTYATLIRALDGVTGGAVRLPYPDANVRLLAWKRGTEMVLTAWTVDGTANLDLRLAACTVTDAFGAASQRMLSGKFAISMFPTYIKGIADLGPVHALLVQRTHDEAALAALLKRQVASRAYLYDFGGTKKVGSVEIGAQPRQFTPVLNDEVYEAVKGYGFTPRGAGQNVDLGWEKDPLEADACRMSSGDTFMVRPKPGLYKLTFHGHSLGASIHVTVKGALDGDHTFEVTNGEPAISLEVQLADAPLTLQPTDYLDLRWLSLTEVVK